MVKLDIAVMDVRGEKKNKTESQEILMVVARQKDSFREGLATAIHLRQAASYWRHTADIEQERPPVWKAYHVSLPLSRVLDPQLDRSLRQVVHRIFRVLLVVH